MADSSTSQHTVSLSRKTEILTKCLFDGPDLPEILTQLAQLLSMLTGTAALTTSLYFFFQKHRQDRATTRLAIFHVILMIENLPDLETRLQHPASLIEYVNAEVMRTMSKHLDATQTETVKMEVKRKVWECLEERLESAAKRPRTAGRTGAQLKRHSAKRASRRARGAARVREPSPPMSPLGSSDLDVESFTDEDSDIDMLDGEQAASTVQPAPAPEPEREPEPTPEPAFGPLHLSFEPQAYVTLSPHTIARTFQNQAVHPALPPLSIHKSAFDPSTKQVNSSFFSHGKRSSMSNLNTGRERTNAHLFTESKLGGRSMYKMSTSEENSGEEEGASGARGKGPLLTTSSPYVGRSMYKAPTLETELSSPARSAHGKTSLLSPVTPPSIPQSSPASQNTYKSPLSSPASEKEIPQPTSAPRTKMSGYGLEYSDPELYTPDASPISSKNFSPTTAKTMSPSMKRVSMLQEATMRAFDPTAIGNAPYKPIFDRDFTPGILGKMPISLSRNVVASRMPLNVLVGTTQTVNNGTWLGHMKESSSPQGTQDYRVPASQKMYIGIDSDREERQNLHEFFKQPKKKAAVVPPLDWPSPIMMYSSSSSSSSDDASVDMNYIPSPVSIGSPPSAQSISPVLPSPVHSHAEVRVGMDMDMDYVPSTPIIDSPARSISPAVPEEEVEMLLAEAQKLLAPQKASPKPATKRGPGRPRKVRVDPETPKQPKKRGRPRKGEVRLNTLPVETPERRSERKNKYGGTFKGL